MSSYSSFQKSVIIDSTIEECNPVVSRMYELFETFGVKLCRPADGYEPKIPGTVGEKDIPILGPIRNRRRFLYAISRAIQMDLGYTWTIDYESWHMREPREKEVELCFYLDISEDKKLIISFNPKIYECLYCEKGYNKLFKEMNDAKEKLAELGAEIIVENVKCGGLKYRKINGLRKDVEEKLQPEVSFSFLDNVMRILLSKPKYQTRLCAYKDNVMRILLSNPELLMKLCGSEDVKVAQDELVQIENKIRSMEERKMKVLKYESLRPEIRLEAKSFLRKEDWLLPEETAGIAQSLALLANWLEQKIPLTPQELVLTVPTPT